MRIIPGAGIVLGIVVAVAGMAAAADLGLSPAQQDNWFQWRGPLSNGVSPRGNPPLTWDEDTNIKWKVKIPGRGTASPIVWGDQIFIVTAVETDRTIELDPKLAEAKGQFKIARPKNYYQFIVMAIDRATGKTRWQHLAKEEVPHEGHHPDASFASASPMTDGQQLYVSFGSRGIYCYDLAGNQKWSRDLGQMSILFTFGEGASPVVHGDSVIVNWDHQKGSFLVCVDKDTGETRWKVDRDETTTWATPLIVEFNGRTQIVVHGGKRVRGYDFKTGELIWACGGQAPAAIPTPVTNGELVYAMSGYMGNALYAIPLDSEGDITKLDDKVAWKRKEKGTPYVPSPLIYGDLLYFTASNSGMLSCLDAKTGEVFFDRKRLEGIQNIYASPVAAADRIYFTGREGTTAVVKKGRELDVLATNKLDDRFDASAAIVGDEIILRGNEFLYCIAAPK